MIKNRRFVKKMLNDFHNETFFECNFTQENPHINPFVDCTKLKFINCNLKNCDIPEDFIIQGCLTGHFTKEITEEEIMFKNTDGSMTTEIIKHINEIKIN